MKICRNLYPEICSFENLYLAARKAQRGKRFQPNVYEFNRNLEENLILLQKELEEKTWSPGQYRNFYIQESKRRMISAAPYQDRVVHHALCNVIEPLFEKTFIFDSYACRKGKGTHAAADRYTEFCRKAEYALKCDISRYFPSISHDILYSQLEKRIGDQDALWLCSKIIYDFNPTGYGIPIGNQTSQFFANVYLNDFDHWIKEKIRASFYIRYVDDFIILHDDKKWLHSLIPPIEEKLAELELKLHEKKRNVFPVSEGCDFMGYRIWRDHRRIRPSNGYRFQRRLKAKARDYKKGLIDWGDAHSSIMTWIGHASHADTWGLRRAIFNKLRFRRDGMPFRPHQRDRDIRSSALFAGARGTTNR
jgi:retron-type reverse transcriptase